MFITSAENSPNECPATISGVISLSFVRAKITECKKIDGCVTEVCLRSSLVPLNMILLILNPKISFAMLKKSAAVFDESNKSLPIPGN